MSVSDKDYKDFLKLRPLNVRKKFGETEAAITSGRDIAAIMKEKNAIVMAANIRNPLSAAGIMKAAKECDAAFMMELAKSENGYCGVHYDNLPDYAVQYSNDAGNGVVFGLHMDHFAIKSEKDRDEGIEIIKNAIALGWTSVAIDASHNPDYANLIFTRDVAMNIPNYVGLEVEVGEIKGKGVLSTVEEAVYYIGGLNSYAIFPDYLAISNGSLHGTYDVSAGQEEGIDLNRTKEIADAIKKYGVVIAQHGISGTPLDKVGTFKNYGIYKGNVGTLWQNVVFGIEIDPNTGNAVIEKDSYVKNPDKGIPMELWEEITAWADDKGFSRKDGSYKKANIVFHDKIMSLDERYKKRIIDETAEWAGKFFEAFNAAGTGSAIIEHILERGDYNSAPERKIIGERTEAVAEKAPDYKSEKTEDGEDFSD